MASKLARPVSIIGTSTLPQRYFDDPAYAGLSIYELWAAVCHQAMDDAGVKPRDIDKVVYSQMANFVTAGIELQKVTTESIAVSSMQRRRLTAPSLHGLRAYRQF